MSETSVIIPLYGNHVGTSRLPVTVRAWLDQRAPVTVVIATAGELALDDDIVSRPGVQVIVAPPTETAPGLLRNIGAAQVSTPWVYLSDADVAPLDTGFLARARAAAGDGAFVQPAMLRMTQSPPERPVSEWRLADEPSDADRLCFVTADPDGTLRRLPGERIVWEDDAPMVYPPPGHGHADDAREVDLRPMFHWGSVLLRREQFEALGGYCTAYRGWGCEDDDLLVKLNGSLPVRHGWRDAPELRLVHFEHPRPYTGEPLRANRDLLRRRRQRGVAAMVADDRAALLAGD
ncbi:hypothetical protein Dvina_19385 [Dactylosporangium vinaceum]|uniref:Galactosyltransferase-related protein n=1 Tax=Dactylosporangium vinaceum TaxID=53362 RepID=A0ABV5M9J7_9ACTN|nr:galactosyltransferase-related protein [Dactylosporangium vinaceum]UAC00026.1 hypothetical protein Dvina_19385 [Dactylosporangium vinaceum]